MDAQMDVDADVDAGINFFLQPIDSRVEEFGSRRQGQKKVKHLLGFGVYCFPLPSQLL